MDRNSFTARAGLLLGMFSLTACFFYTPAVSKVSILLGDGWNEWAAAIFFKTYISQGILPLWNPDVGFGVPDWISYSPFALHLLSLFFAPPEIVWNLVKILNFILSGWFLSLYLLRRKDMFIPAFLGGLIISIAQLNVDIVYASYFLFLLSFLLADRLVNVRSNGAALVFSISFLIFCLSALPQPIICATLFLFCYIAVRFQLRRNFNVHLCLLTIFPFVVCFMFFLPQILRVNELLHLSVRASVADKEVFSILPWEYLHIFWPNFMMNSQDPTLNIIPGRMVTALQNFVSPFVNVRFGQFTNYGIFPSFACVCLFFKKDLKYYEKVLLSFLVFMLLIPILNPIIYPIVKRIPVIGLASSSSLFGATYNYILLLVVSILTALLIGYLSDSKIFSEFNLASIKRLFVGFVAFVIFASIIRLFIFISFHFKGEAVRERLNDLLTPIFSLSQFHYAPEFYMRRIAQASNFLKLWSSPKNVYFVMPIFLILSSIVTIYGRLTKRIGKIFFFIICFVLMMLDARIYHPMSFYDAKDIAPLKEEANFIKQDKSIFRVMALQDESSQAADAGANDLRNIILRPETHLIYGLSSSECYRSLVIKDYHDYMSRMIAEGGSRGRLVGEFKTIKNTSLLDLANIKYLIAPLSKGMDAFPPEHYEHVFQTTRCNIFKNKFAKERGFLLHSQQGTGFVTIDQYLPHRVCLDVETNIPNELVLSDQHYPGWRAYVDNVETQITKFQGTFRKITIPSGHHKVEFRFQPAYLSHGMTIPLLALIMGAWALRRNT